MQPAGPKFFALQNLDSSMKAILKKPPFDSSATLFDSSSLFSPVSGVTTLNFSTQFGL
jgi:hypothetical protein